jgi:hypothetical protein
VPSSRRRVPPQVGLSSSHSHDGEGISCGVVDSKPVAVGSRDSARDNTDI